MKEETKLSKHNYSQYSSKKPANSDANSVVEKTTLAPADLIDVSDVKMEVEVPVIETTGASTMPELTKETIDTVVLPKTIKGVVVNCAKLNVRAYPSRDAEVVCILDVTSEVEVYTEKSTYDWVCVCTVSGIEGYCMKKFIDADL